MNCHWFRRPQRDEELDEEIQSYLELSADERMARGETEEQARLHARRAFGNVGLVKEDTRAVWGGVWLERGWQDLRFGLRMLRKHPGFSLTAILTLALGIGANTALFGFINALLLRPLAGVNEPERLVQVGRQYANKDYLSDASYPDYLDYREQSMQLSGLAALASASFHLSTGQEAVAVAGEAVSGNFFDVLGVKAAQGRLLSSGDEPGGSVAVISHRLWQRRFGGADVAGQVIKLNGHDFTVVGVAAAAFDGITIGARCEVWTPLMALRQLDAQRASLLEQRGASWLKVFGRLKPGVTMAQARAELSAIAERLKQTYPKTHRYFSLAVASDVGRDSSVRNEVRRFAAVPFAAVGIVLLIACANVAGLWLARATARQKEIGVRLALGASRGRVIRQLLTESLLLALGGGAAGLLVGFWLTQALRGLLPERYLSFTFDFDFGMDGRVFAFTLAVTVLTGLLCGLVPAWQASRPDLIGVLKDARLAGPRGGGTGLRGALVVTQVALSLVLLIAAGLCVRTLRNAQAIDTGYEIEQVLAARLDLGKQNYSEAQGRMFQQQLLERLHALPGVQAAAFALNLPLNDTRYRTTVYPEGESGRSTSTFQNFISPRYLETMEMPLLLGRTFSARDDAGAPPVALINQTLARRLWPHESPLGKRLTLSENGDKQATAEVIGVTRDSKGRDLLAQADPLFYLPLLQHYQPRTVLHLRTSLAPEELVATLRQTISALDRNLPLHDIQPLREHFHATLTPQRLLASFISGFGLLALLLAGVGLYGLLAYTVARRTPEIGLRMALGAGRREVLALVMKQGFTLALGGVLLGLGCAFALTRGLKAALYGVSPTDPLTFAAIAVLLLLVALLACWIPAWRATKVDPLIALRQE